MTHDFNGADFNLCDDIIEVIVNTSDACMNVSENIIFKFYLEKEGISSTHQFDYKEVNIYPNQ